MWVSVPEKVQRETLVSWAHHPHADVGAAGAADVVEDNPFYGYRRYVIIQHSRHVWISCSTITRLSS